MLHILLHHLDVVLEGEGVVDLVLEVGLRLADLFVDGFELFLIIAID